MKNINKQLKNLNKSFNTIIARAFLFEQQRQFNEGVGFGQCISDDSPNGATMARGLLDDLEVDKKTKVKVNIEKKVTFTATNPIDGPLDMRTISCEILGSTSASIADAPAGTTPRATASFGKSLTITTNTKGKAEVYVLDGTAEKFKVKGTLTGSAFMPTATTTITVT